MVEYTLSVPKGAEPALESDIRFSRAALENAGGRTFDLDVDILDPLSFEIMAELNRSVDMEQAGEAALQEITPAINYLSKSIMREAFKAFPPAREGKAMDPLGVGEESYGMNDMFNVITNRPDAQDNTSREAPTANGGSVALSGGKDNASKHLPNPHVVNVFQEGGIRIHSAVHNFRGYIDVGDDSCFVDVSPQQPKTRAAKSNTVCGDSSVLVSSEDGATGVSEKNKSLSWLREASSAFLPRPVSATTMDVDGGEGAPASDVFENKNQ